MRNILYAVTIAALVSVSVFTQPSGGAFMPSADYTITGNWTFSGTPIFGTGTASTSAVTVGGTQTLTNKTLTAPAITGAATVAAGATITSPIVVGASESTAATRAVLAADSGKTFFFGNATEFDFTLPSPAAGLHYRFIVAIAPSGTDYSILTPASAQIIAGSVLSSSGAAEDTEAAATANAITFQTGAAVIGDRVDISSDGTSWFAVAVCSAAGGITFEG